MNDVELAAFGLISLLCVANSVLLVGIMRQVGVLHERIRPTGAGDHDGPEVGNRISRPQLIAVDDSYDARLFEAPITILGFVSPGCGLCDELAAQTEAYRKHRSHELVELALVTEASLEEAARWRREHHVRVPFFRAEQVKRDLGITATPYVVALSPDPAGGEWVRVLAAGVVNTLEQLEDLVEAAETNLANIASDEEPEDPIPTARPPEAPTAPSNGAAA
jgi:methylamine dehydrogenase accessory protein MauD